MLWRSKRAPHPGLSSHEEGQSPGTEGGGDKLTRTRRRQQGGALPGLGSRSQNQAERATPLQGAPYALPRGTRLGRGAVTWWLLFALGCGHGDWPASLPGWSPTGGPTPPTTVPAAGPAPWLCKCWSAVRPGLIQEPPGTPQPCPQPERAGIPKEQTVSPKSVELQLKPPRSEPCAGDSEWGKAWLPPGSG